MNALRVGCSGWNYKHWRERVYPKRLPPRRWLAHYATSFDTVEINTTFYRLPLRTVVQAWVDESPPGFLFAVKASRFLTHIKRLRDLEDGVALFYERIAPLVDAEKLGPVLWQLPERFHRDDDRLARALAQLPPGRHAFEFRHPSWFVPEVSAILRAHRAALVIGDHPNRPFQTDELTADWVYLRFHSGREAADGDYSAAELARWARKIAAWRATADVYAYFNNDWQGYAVENARALARLAAHPDVVARRQVSPASRAGRTLRRTRARWRARRVRASARSA